MSKPMVFLASQEVEGVLSPDDQVVLFEDVVTAGGSVRRNVEALQSKGARVIGIGSVLDRGSEKSRLDGVPYASLFYLSETVLPFLLREQLVDPAAIAAAQRFSSAVSAHLASCHGCA